MVTSSSAPQLETRAKSDTHECPIDAVLRLLMGPWTTYILYVLRTQGPRRFGELKREVGGISAKVLTERLRMLEEARLVHRDYQATIPPQVTYSLASRGAELNPMLDALKDIALRWRDEDQRGMKPGIAAEAAARQAAE